MTAFRTMASVCAVVVGLLAGTAVAVNIETVPVGDPGNAGDTRYDGYGSVGYTYNIGKYEVTAGQYAEFLNCKGGVDNYRLYNTNMANPWNSTGIIRTGGGTEGNPYAYSVAPDYVNRPVRWVSLADACRFANWLHNGGGNGDTETGAYTLTYSDRGGTGGTSTRNANWGWAVTSRDEWYKAAYYKGGSTNAGYWDFPTSSDTKPGQDVSDASGNNANHGGYPYPIMPYYVNVVGHFHNSDSPYGTFDQAGNVWEWNDTALPGNWYHARGGSFDSGYGIYLKASTYPRILGPFEQHDDLGFRVVQIPEPATIVMLSLAGLGILRRRTA